MQTGRPWAWLERLSLILTVALLLRLAVAIMLPLPADFMFLSEPGWTAANLAAGQGYTYDFYGTRPDNPLLAFVPPLHPWFIALALLAPEPALTLGIMQALLGTLTVWLVYRLAHGLAGQRVGTLAGWGAALYPAHILSTSQPISAVLHACCLTSVLFGAWLLYCRPGIKHGLLAGGLAGLLALSRPQILAFLPLIMLWLWLNGVRGRPFWRSAAALGLAAALVVLPWSLRNMVVLGRPLPTPTNGGVTFWNGNNPFTTGSGHDVYADRLAAFRGVPRDPALPAVYEHPEPYPFPPEIESLVATMPELALDHAFYRAGLDYIRQQPLDWLRLEGRKLLSFWLFRPNLGANPLYQDQWTAVYRVQYILLLVLVIPGVALAARRWRRYALLWALFGYYTLVHLVFNVLTRYRWEFELLLLIFAALALEWIGRRLMGQIKQVWLRLLVWLADWQLVPVMIVASVLLFPDRFPRVLVALALSALPALWILYRLARGHFFTRTPVDVALLVLLLTLPLGMWMSARFDVTWPHIAKVLLGFGLFYALVNMVAGTGNRQMSGLGWMVVLGTTLLALLVLAGTAWVGAKLASLPADLTGRLPRLFYAFWNPEGFHPNIAGGLLAISGAGDGGPPLVRSLLVTAALVAAVVGRPDPDPTPDSIPRRHPWPGGGFVGSADCGRSSLGLARAGARCCARRRTGHMGDAARGRPGVGQRGARCRDQRGGTV